MYVCVTSVGRSCADPGSFARGVQALRAKTLFNKSSKYFNCFACMLYNKAAANGSYLWKQEDHQHKFLYTQALYKDPEAILSKRNTKRSEKNIMHRTRQILGTLIILLCMCI